jgi:hypothetical protein
MGGSSTSCGSDRHDSIIPKPSTQLLFYSPSRSTILLITGDEGS